MQRKPLCQFPNVCCIDRLVLCVKTVAISNEADFLFRRIVATATLCVRETKSVDGQTYLISYFFFEIEVLHVSYVG